MPRTPNEIFIAYERGHVGEALKRAEQGATIVCMDFFVGRELARSNTPYVSMRDLLDPETAEEGWYALAHNIAREWYRLSAMSFFTYEGIPIAAAPEHVIQTYLAGLFYYVRRYALLNKAYPKAHFYIPSPQPITDTYYLRSYAAWVPVDAARMVGLRFTTNGARAIPTIYRFSRPTWKSFVLRAYNLLVSLTPRRGLKIYASGYWGHFAPVVDAMNDTEVVFLESKKFYAIPWRLILKHRIRVRPIHGEISANKERAIREIEDGFKKEWEVAKGGVADYLKSVRREFDWSTVLEALGNIMTYAPRIIFDIDTLLRILQEEKPDVVVQMGFIGDPHNHLYLMTHVAARLKIPSLELQHSSITVDPRAAGSHVETDCIATYGTDINKWRISAGTPSEKLIAVGSPRFDKYTNKYAQGVEVGRQFLAQLGLDTSRPVLLIAVPHSASLVVHLDSYQLAEFIESIRNVQNKIPGLQVLFKFRQEKHIGLMREYLQGLFKGDMAITGNTDIFSLLCASSAVVCNLSTTIYEAVLAKKPLVVYPWKAFDTYNAPIYAQEIPLAYTAEEAIASISRIFTETSYRDELMKKQEEFLKKYSFDGRSSERVAKLLHDIPELYKKSHQPRS